MPPAELLARAVERWGTPRVLVADRYKQRELADAAGAVPELARTHRSRSAGKGSAMAVRTFARSAALASTAAYARPRVCFCGTPWLKPESPRTRAVTRSSSRQPGRATAGVVALWMTRYRPLSLRWAKGAAATAQRRRAPRAWWWSSEPQLSRAPRPTARCCRVSGAAAVGAPDAWSSTTGSRDTPVVMIRRTIWSSAVAVPHRAPPAAQNHARATAGGAQPWPRCSNQAPSHPFGRPRPS